MSPKTIVRSASAVLTALILSAALVTGCGRKTNPDLERGLAAYRAGDFRSASEFFSKAAEQGDAEAQYRLAACYAQGTGVAADKDLSLRWLLKAAEQGHSKAQCMLAFCYEQGNGVAADPDEARKWIGKAIAGLTDLAEQGDVEALSYLAACYGDGFGIEQDEAKAVSLLTKAAEQGHVQSQLLLGLNSIGQKNSAEAVKWLKRAAEQGNADAQILMGKIYESGMGMPDVRTDKAEAVKWYGMAASGDTILARAARDAIKRLEETGAEEKTGAEER